MAISQQNITYSMIPEWESHKAILMAMPHRQSDWAQSEDLFEEAKEQFVNIFKIILRYENLVVLVRDDSKWLEDIFAKEIKDKRLKLLHIDFNDTWTRDYGVIGTRINGDVALHNFRFNAWGGKFAYELDDIVNTKMLENHIFGDAKMTNHTLILEGGSIECNANGEMLTTEQCLLNPNRNPNISKQYIQSYFKKWLGIRHIHWLKHGALVGDDTDSHVDNLARFIDNHTIAYVKCDDATDEHYVELNALENELKSLKDINGKSYNLLPLPLPTAIYDETSRLPASYVNFLFVKNALLVPTYNVPSDMVALDILRKACKDKEIVATPCSTLIKWHGSLHCSTMQLY